MAGIVETLNWDVSLTGTNVNAAVVFSWQLGWPLELGIFVIAVRILSTVNIWQ